MKGYKKLLSLVLSTLMIVSLIPSSVFATSGTDSEFEHFTEVVLNEENFPDPKFRQSVSKHFGVEEGQVINYDEAVKKKPLTPMKLEFETDNFAGFNYIVDIGKSRNDSHYGIELDISAPYGKPFPFELMSDLKCSLDIRGVGEKKQILNYSNIYSLNKILNLGIYYGEEEETKEFDVSKFSDEMKNTCWSFDFRSSDKKAAEKPFILDLKEISDYPKCSRVRIEAYQFDLKDGIKLRNLPVLNALYATACTDKIKINNCPNFEKIEINGTYIYKDSSKFPSPEAVKSIPENKYGKNMPIEVLDISDCKDSVQVRCLFTNLKDIKVRENQLANVTIDLCGASLTRDDYPYLKRVHCFDNRQNAHYEMPLKRDKDGKLYFDMNEVVGKENIGNVDFSSSINEKNGFSYDKKTGHFTVGDSVSGIKGINYVYKSEKSISYYPYVVFIDYINQKPEVVLNSEIKENTVTINQGEKFDATKYAKVKDVEDTKKPRDIDASEITSNVNPNVIGDYEVTYVAKDSSNLESNPVTLKVKVKEDPVAAELKEIKKQAKVDLTKNIADYEAFKDSENVKAAVAEGERAIDKAVTKDEVANIVKSEKAKIIEAVKDAKSAAEAKLLAEAKVRKLDEIEKVVLGVDESKYTSESLDAASAKLNELKEKAKAEVEKAKTLEEVETVSVNVDEAKKVLVTKEAASNEKIKEAEKEAAELRALATEKRNAADAALAEAEKARENVKDNKTEKIALELEKEALEKDIEALNADVKAAEAEAKAAQVKATEFNTEENIKAAEEAAKKVDKVKTENDKKVEASERRIVELDKDIKVLADSIIVEEKIVAIGKVTLERENAVKEARKAYDNLTEASKKKVMNLDVLETAEKELAALQEEAKKPEVNPEQKPVDKPAAKPEGNNKPTSGNRAPETGDSGNMFVLILMLIASLMSAKKIMERRDI